MQGQAQVNLPTQVMIELRAVVLLHHQQLLATGQGRRQVLQRQRRQQAQGNTASSDTLRRQQVRRLTDRGGGGTEAYQPQGSLPVYTPPVGAVIETGKLVLALAQLLLVIGIAGRRGTFLAVLQAIGGKALTGVAGAGQGRNATFGETVAQVVAVYRRRCRQVSRGQQ